MGTTRSIRSSVIAISHLPILPPLWATLPTDGPDALAHPPPMLHVPGTIHLDEGARCVCGIRCREREMTILQACVVYTLTSAQQTLLEVQACHECPRILRRSIGPDGGGYGLLNLNNTVLFTHDLLDDYTAAFTSSETPFSAWVGVMRKRYTRHGSLLPFAHEAIFRNAWFSYSSLQQLEGDMNCPKCGPAPADVIWDGVSLSFHRKHLLPSLHPPTKVHASSLIRDSRYHIQAAIENSNLRQSMRKIITATFPSAVSSTSISGMDLGHQNIALETEVETDGSGSQDMTSSLELIFKVHEELKRVDESLASCFYSNISLTFVSSGKKCQREYLDFFSQVSTQLEYMMLSFKYPILSQIASDDSVLQIVTRSLLVDLSCFVEDPTKEKASALVSVPAIYNILRLEERASHGYSPDLLGVCKWLAGRANAVLEIIIIHPMPSIDKNIDVETDWRQASNVIKLLYLVPFC